MEEDDDYNDYTYEDQNDEEEYAYSDCGEPEMKRSVSEPIYEVPDSSYKIVDYTDLLPMMNRLIKEVSNILSTDRDTSESLLYYSRWNKERLVDRYYNNPEKVMREAGCLTSSKTQPDDAPCTICGDANDPSSVHMLSCGHQFCNTCYESYLQIHVRDGQACVTLCCPEPKCTQRIPLSTYEKFLTGPLKEKHTEYLTRNFIERSVTMRWCTSPTGCQKVAIGSGITTVRCLCNYPFCFRCGEEAHDPSSCDQLAVWNLKCKDESETANWILANTKKCSKCQIRIEKNQGCNHMTCKVCKHEFCWICMGPWSEHGQNSGGYYKCNRFENNAVDVNATKAKLELDRYLHYYQRFHEHNNSLKFASKQREIADSKMVQLQESEKSAWINVQYLRQAVDQVIECRRVLKFTYVLG
jgi:ariadne-1